jgi:nucleotide-binding universal stress UspA family protein
MIYTGLVIVGVDASENAARAALWAADDAAERGAGLHIVHAIGSEPEFSVTRHRAAFTHDDRLELLDRTLQQARAAHPDLDVTTELAHGSAAAVLVEASREADLLVTGTRGHGGFAGLPVGSVSLRLAAHARCPAVMVRGHAHRVADHGRIVLGVDHDTPPEAVLFAFNEADRAGVGILAVRAWAVYPSHTPGFVSDTDVLARHAGEDVAAKLKDARGKYPEVPVTIDVRQGHPVLVLTHASRDARLTVVAAHRRHGPFSLGAGSVIQGLLSQARSPVAVVPGGFDGPGAA